MGNDKPDMNLQQFIEQLSDKNGFEREYARKELVAKGEKAVPYLVELTDDPLHILRWESMKALSEMGLPSLTHFFIEKLENDESDVRWIAAEGLIKIGPSAVKPILRALMEKSDSVFLLSGSHHIIHALLGKNQLRKDLHFKKLLPLLKITSIGERLKIMIHETLNELE